MAGYNPYNGGYNGYQNGYGAYNPPVNPYSSAAIMQNNGGYMNGNANMGAIPQNNNMATLPYNNGNMGQPNNNVSMPSANGMMQNSPQMVMQSNPAPIQQQAPVVMPQQTQQMNNTIQMNPIQGISNQSRVVGSKTEAESVPADFLGAPIIMPMLVNGEVSAIFVKQWDVNRGQANFGEFYKYQENINTNIQNDSSNNNGIGNTNNNNLAQQSQEIAPISFATAENVQNMQNIMNGMQDTINYLQDEIAMLKSKNNRDRLPIDSRYPMPRREYPVDDSYEEYGYDEYMPEPPRNRRYEKQYGEQTDGRPSLVEPEEKIENHNINYESIKSIENSEVKEEQVSDDFKEKEIEQQFEIKINTSSELNSEDIQPIEKPLIVEEKPKKRRLNTEDKTKGNSTNDSSPPSFPSASVKKKESTKTLKKTKSHENSNFINHQEEVIINDE